MQTEVKGFRLSPQQRRVWSLLQHSPAYRAQCAILLEGELSRVALRRAAEQVISRHEILRTTFHRVPGMKFPVQVIADAGVFSWLEFDLSGRAQPEQEIEDLFRQEGHLLFQQSAPLRVSLLKLSKQKHVLILTLSSLCADAWTLENLVRVVSRSYAAGLRGEEWPDEPIQYAQFSEWQNELLDNQETVEANRYEPDPYKASFAAFKFPFERQLDEQTIFDPATFARALEPGLVDKIDAAARKYSVPVDVLLLASWQMVLWRLIGQSDLTIGRVCDGRKYEELGDALGLFTKPLPIHCHFDEDFKFPAVLDRVYRSTRDADDRQEYFHRDSNGGRAEDAVEFSAHFEYEDWPPKYSAAALSFSVYKRYACADRFKVKLSCIRRGGSLVAEFHYDPGLFYAEDIERLAGYFQTLLNSAINRPEAAIRDLEMLGEAERHRLEVEWNATVAEYPQEACLPDLFEAQVGRTPEAIAAISGEAHLSYGELNRWANRLAHYLRGLGVGPDVPVGLYLERSLEMLVGLLAVLKAGGAYVPLDLSYPKPRLDFLLADARVQVLLTRRRWADVGQGAGVPPVCLDDRRLVREQDPPNPVRTTRAENLAYVMYTSGSTGRPKGVMIPHRGLVNYLSWCTRAYDVARGPGSAVHSSIGFDLTVTSLLAPLLGGQRVVLLPEEQGIEALGAALGRGESFGLVKITPAHLQVLSQQLAKAESIGPVGTLVIGGEALRGESLSFWRRAANGTRLINEYGPTETVVGCCVYEVAAQGELGGAVPIGRPIANTRLYVVDGHRRSVPVGVAGELYIGGDGLARGYLNRPEQTALAFVPDPFGGLAGGRLYRTGDLARYLPDGNLEFLGRVDHQVKVRGYRIEVGEVEAVLCRQAGVREAAVTVHEDASGHKRLVAYVAAEAEESASVGRLQASLRTELPEYMVPTAFVRLERLPLTANGKIDRRALLAPTPAQLMSEEAFVPPQTPVQEILAGIWAEVLGLERVGVHDNFFNLGGDSIRSVQVVALAKERGLNFTIQQLFQYQTISQLAQELKLGEGPSIPELRTEPFSLISQEDRLKLSEDIADAYPLTMLQSGMLYHMALTPEAPDYHIVNNFRIQAAFDLTALREAVQRVVARHPVLRTSFDLTTYSEPLQLVHKTAHLPIPVEDLRHLPSGEQEAAVTRFVAEEQKRPFEWSCPPLIRIHILRRADDIFNLLLTEFHPIWDGWSLTSTLTEIFNGYFALLNGETLPQPSPPPISFRDFVLLERKVLESEECRQYWAQKLNGCAPTRIARWTAPLEAAGSPRVRKLSFQIPAPVLEGLKRLARSAAVPLKSVFLAAHAKVISRISSSREILTGLHCHGRPEVVGSEQVRGLFLNTVPFRLLLPKGTWRDLVLAAFEGERELLPYQRYPLAALQKSWGRQLLFDTAFNYVNFHSLEPSLNSGRVKVLDARDSGGTNFTLETAFSLTPWRPGLEVLVLVLEYDTAALSLEQVKAIGEYYKGALSALAKDPDGRHDGQNLLPPAEQHQILVEWNATKTAYPIERGLPELFEAQVERSPDAVAVVASGEHLSYRALNRRSNQLAHHLWKLGVGTEISVGLCMERSLEMVIGLLGILKAGGTYVPLDPTYPRERLAFMLADAQAPVVLTQAQWVNELESIGAKPGRSWERCAVAEPSVRVMCLDKDWAALEGEPRDNPLHIGTADDLAYVIYTSGSTGQPKGAMNTQRGLCNRLLWMQRQYPLSAGDRVLQKTPINFDISIWEFFWPLLTGACLVMARPEGHKDSAYIKQLVAGERITALHFVPSMLRIFLQEPGLEDCRSIRWLFCSGEALSLDLQEQFFAALDAELHNLYGPTEAAIEVTFWACERTSERRTVPIGRPIANTQIYILDPDGQPVPIGVPGQLYIGGIGLARGYLHQPNLTAAKFRPDPFGGERGARLYETGDLARYLPDGAVEFLGRIDYQVKIRGFRIEPGEVETILRQHGAVREAAVLAYEDKAGDKRLAAYVVARSKETPTDHELRQFLKGRLPDYMIPSAIMWLEALPLTPSGKLNRLALPTPVSGASHAAHYVEPQSDTERVIAGVWQQVLQLDKVSINDNFFDLGGDSIRLLRVFSKLRTLLKPDLSMTEMFQYPTIEALVKFISRDQSAQVSFQASYERAERQRQALRGHKPFMQGQS